MPAGCSAGLKALFAGLPPENFAAALERSGVTPAALGTGYVVFFAYSALIGVFAVVMALVVRRRTRDDARVAAG